MLTAEAPSPVLTVISRSFELYTNPAEVSIVAYDEDWAEEKIYNALAEIKRICWLLNPQNSHGPINQVNRNAGVEAVKVDAEVFKLVSRLLKISALTEGAFDVTYASVSSFYHNAGSLLLGLPDAGTAAEAIKLVDYRNVLADDKNTTLFLKEKGMRLGLGGVALAYAVDRAKYLLQMQGVSSGVIKVAGNTIAWGLQADKKPWVASLTKNMPGLSVLSKLNISNMAVITYDSFDNYTIIDGKKYAHKIDPRTGKHLRGIKSVTMISPSAELAAALGLSVMVVGVKKGLYLVNRLNQLACVVVNDDKKVYMSKNLS